MFNNNWMFPARYITLFYNRSSKPLAFDHLILSADRVPTVMMLTRIKYRLQIYMYPER